MTKRQVIRKYGDNMKREDLVTLKAKRNDNNNQSYMELFLFGDDPCFYLREPKTKRNSLKEDSSCNRALKRDQRQRKIQQSQEVYEDDKRLISYDLCVKGGGWDMINDFVLDQISLKTSDL